MQLHFKGHFASWGGSQEHTAYAFQDPGGGETEVAYFKNCWWDGVPSSQLLPTVDGGQIDFQVKVMVGYNLTDYSYDGYLPLNRFIILSESNWSEVQTITLPSTNSTIPQLTPTPTPILSAVQPQYPEPTGSLALPPEHTGTNLFSEINLNSDLLIQAAVLALVFIVVAALIVIMVRPR